MSGSKRGGEARRGPSFCFLSFLPMLNHATHKRGVHAFLHFCVGVEVVPESTLSARGERQELD